MKTPYIKPTRRVHDSGYRIFELGYHDGDDNITKLGECSDHIYQDYFSPPFRWNMDLTKKGYIRFFSHDGDLRWKHENCIVSSASLICIPREN